MTARAAQAAAAIGYRPERRAIRVYYADVRNVGASEIAARVTDDDRDRIKAITLPSRRTQFLVGRALLRHALERCTGRPAASHRLIAGASRKPECPGGPSISLTHNGPIVACAISPLDDVGIDVQFPAPHVHTGDIASRYFSAGESHWLLGAPTDAFYMLWVLKEAYLKAVGRGLGGGLSQVDCRVVPPCITAATAIQAGFALYSLGNGFLGVASIGRGLPEIAVERWNPSRAVALSRLRLLATTA